MTLSTYHRQAACSFGLILSSILLFIPLFWSFSSSANVSEEIFEIFMFILLMLGISFFLFTMMSLGVDEPGAHFFGMLVGGIIILIELLWGLNHSKQLLEGSFSYMIVIIGFVIFMAGNFLLAKHKDDAPLYALFFGGLLIVTSVLLTIFSNFDLQNAIFMISISAIMTFLGLLGAKLKQI